MLNSLATSHSLACLPWEAFSKVNAQDFLSVQEKMHRSILSAMQLAP